MRLVLQATRLHWLADDGADHPDDLCAHSPVAFEIDGTRLVEPEDGAWTVSASSIFLLRSLTEGHQLGSGFGNQLFPCCGHGIFKSEEGRVDITGCSNGVDFDVAKEGALYVIRNTNKEVWSIPSIQWRNAVIEFSDTVRRFYTDALPKEPVEDYEKEGFQTMIQEWDHRSMGARAEQASDGKPDTAAS